ncbi:hypothetical protein GE09DRAFT_57518 [Coniochaeta sp. 2T2.1]|nr:hypothetical protein GE09DRAFT_57518 [Coniochaeta sp. 2T2.1]
MWIVQEIVLANDVIFVCGHWAASWTRLCRATTVLMDNSADELSEATLRTGEFDHFGPALRGIGLLKRLKLLKHSMGSARLPEECPLSTLLLMGRSYNATDPLDKVYGILGLLRGLGTSSQLEVRYRNMTVCDLYMRATERLYSEGKNLNFLRLVEVNRSIDQIRGHSLPSWAPDFTLPTSYPPIFSRMRFSPRWRDKVDVSRELSGTFAFTGDLQSRCTFDLRRKTIIVTGFRVDTIQTFSTRIVDVVENFKADGAVSYGKRICATQPDEVEESVLEGYWDSVLGQECGNARAWVTAEQEVGVGNGPATPRVDPQCFQTATMRLVGITDAAIAEDDCICGLLGLGVPCILRRQQGSWRFVGLSGIMGPDIMLGSLTKGLETGKFAVEEFAII